MKLNSVQDHTPIRNSWPTHFGVCMLELRIPNNDVANCVFTFKNRMDMHVLCWKMLSSTWSSPFYYVETHRLLSQDIEIIMLQIICCDSNNGHQIISEYTVFVSLNYVYIVKYLSYRVIICDV